MRKITTILLICIFLLLTTSSLVGCTKDTNRFSTELFKCMYNEDKTGVIILELTEKGQEQEILVIPEEINGLPVVQLGGDANGHLYTISYGLDSDVVKKIYFKTNQEKGIIGVKNFLHTWDIDIIIISRKCNYESIIDRFNSGQMITQGYINNNFYSDINQDEIIINENYTIKKCNTYFYIEKDEIYWLDIINEKDYHVIPKEPTKMGLRFAGWYYEEECINKWDEKFILPTDADELKLYAKWVQND